MLNQWCFWKTEGFVCLFVYLLCVTAGKDECIVLGAEIGWVGKLRQKKEKFYLCWESDAEEDSFTGEFRSLALRLKGVWWEDDLRRGQEQMACLKRLLHGMEGSATSPFILDLSEFHLCFLPKVNFESQGSMWWAQVYQSRRDQCLNHLVPRFLPICLCFPLLYLAPSFRWFSPNYFHSLLWNAPSLPNYIWHNQHFKPLSLICEYLCYWYHNEFYVNKLYTMKAPWYNLLEQDREHSEAIRTFLGTKPWCVQEFLVKKFLNKYYL